MAFSTYEILSEFVDAGAFVDPAQTEFTWQSIVTDRRVCDDARRARSRRDYHLRKARPRTKVESMALARKAYRKQRRQRMVDALATIRAARKMKRAA